MWDMGSGNWEARLFLDGDDGLFRAVIGIKISLCIEHIGGIVR